MDILIMQVFVSLLLVLGSVLLFLFSAKQRDFDHADRLALLPINDDDDVATVDGDDNDNDNDNDNHKKESR